jgi:hypothetical protein
VSAEITPGLWHALMQAIALDGVRVPVALKRFDISPAAFRRLLRTEPHLLVQFVRCKRHAKHRRFPILVVDEMLSELARTKASFKEIVLRRGYSQSAYKRLVDLIWRTSEWKEAYLSARRAKVMRLRAGLSGLPDDALLSMGRRGFSKAVFAVHSMTPMRDRRAAAAVRRAARAAVDPIYAARQRAQRRGRNEHRTQQNGGAK